MKYKVVGWTDYTDYDYSRHIFHDYIKNYESFHKEMFYKTNF